MIPIIQVAFVPRPKQPHSLYTTCIDVSVAHYGRQEGVCKIRELPDNILFDIYYNMYKEKRLCLLLTEFNDVHVLNRMIRIKHNRGKLLESFQATINHGSKITDDIFSNYRRCSGEGNTNDSTYNIDIGLRIAAFFNEGGWYKSAINILMTVERECLTKETSAKVLLRLLDCYHKRLRAESIFCMFKEADLTLSLAEDVISRLEELNMAPNLAGFYASVSSLYFVRSEYDQAYRWTTKSLEILNSSVPSRVKVEILRQASKTCVVKRHFKQAKLLIDEALAIVSSLTCGSQLLYSDVLMDFGYYLLNYDSIKECVKVYEKALFIRKHIFYEDNIHIAIGHEDLAYALYVNEYSSGRFFSAKSNAEEALHIMDRILPKEHLMLAFAMRVKALILEEIALDLRNGNYLHDQDELLQESEKLHQEALKLSFNAFGEHNVQTAKHYGNLGRLYQTMMKYEAAESMHLKAIAIKEEIFGPDDYEVGLSIGHLASLYSYHMGRHSDAEKLYKRSINISLKLFGPYYSGLEYDYRGLIHVYTEMSDIENLLTYTRIAREWKLLRENHTVQIELQKTPQPISNVIEEFFSMC